MEIYSLFVLTGVIIFLGFIGEIVFKKTNIPDVIWLMLFGIIIGPIIKLVDPTALTEIAPLFTTFALIFILFEGALSLKFRDLFKGMFAGSSLALINFFVSLLVVMVVGIIFGFGIVPSILLGAILAGTSSAVVIPIIRRLNVAKETSTALMLESAISDVLCIIGVVTIVQILEIGKLQLQQVLQGILISFVIALFVGALGGFIWIKILSRIKQYSKSYMITIAFMLLVFGFSEYMKSNGAIACLAFGIMLGNSRSIEGFANHNPKQTIKAGERFFYSEISFLVKTFFFVYLGILLQFSRWLPYVIAGIMVIGLYLARPASTWVLRGKITDKDRAVMESLIPKGLAAAVLSQLPIQAGIVVPEIFTDVALATVLVSIVIGTVLVMLVSKDKFWGVTSLYVKFARKKEVVESEFQDTRSS